MADPEGKELAAAITLNRDGVPDAALPVRLTALPMTDGCPTIDALLTELKAKLDGKTKTALAGDGIWLGNLPFAHRKGFNCDAGFLKCQVEISAHICFHQGACL